MRKYNLLLCLLISIAFNAAGQSFQPVNKNASPEAKKILKFLYEVNGKGIITGEHNFNEQPKRFSDSVKAITGKYPGLWGTDFIMDGTRDAGPEIVQEAINKSKEGYLISLMWHEGRPTDEPPYDWKKSVQGKLTPAQWTELTIPGTALNKKWLADIDRIAGYLKQLQDAHVPVLWRPYHEMNGVWFWWGDKRGENGVQKLWKMMYDRYTNYHHLNNLLWVWGANGLRDIPKDEAFDYKLYYPGAAYVDVLGADIYHFDYDQDDYQKLVDLANGKIVALTEVGEMPKPEVLEAQPKWAWFMVWTNFILNDNPRQRVKEMFNMPQVLSHDEVKAKLNDLK